MYIGMIFTCLFIILFWRLACNSYLCELSGPLTEVNLPLDNFTKKIKGFAFVTYMIPEHAVKAYTELDGQVFQVCDYFVCLYIHIVHY